MILSSHLIRIHRRLAFAVLCELTGCSLLGPESPDLRVTMQATSYTTPVPGDVVTVSFTVMNDGSTPAYVVSCGNAPLPTVQRNYPWGWEDYAGDGCIALAGMSPALLAPGQSLTGTWRWHESGRYRLRLQYGPALTESHSRTAMGPSFDIR